MSAKVQGALFPLMFATNQPYTVNQQTESEYKDLPSKDRRGSRINTDRFSRQAPKAQASRGSAGMLPQEMF